MTSAANERLSRDQKIALRAMRANFGEVSEALIFLEGLNSPRRTLDALVRRGLAERVEWWGENNGYIYTLTEAGRGVLS